MNFLKDLFERILKSIDIYGKKRYDVDINEVIVVKRKAKSKKGAIFMKSTGIVRKVDELGRTVLPKELRQTLNINEKNPIEIFVDNPSIILQKYEPACMFSNNTNDMVQYMGRNIVKNV